MLTKEGCQQRQQLLWQRVPNQAHWLLIGDARHIQYLSNFRVNPLSFSSDQRALLLLTRDGRSILLADNFTKRSATVDYFVDQEVIIPWYTHKRSVFNRDDSLCAALQDVEDIWSRDSGIIEPEGVSEMVAATVAEQAQWQFEDRVSEAPGTLGDAIRALRRVKRPDEVELIRRCMQAGEAGHARAVEVITAGLSELDVFLEVQRAAQQAAGCPSLVYGDFRATNASLHKAGGLPTDYRLKNGDLFILDFSVVIHGYRSDITNTIAVGTPDPSQTKQCDACLEALGTTAAALKEGMRCRDLWTTASATLQNWGYGPLAHHAGHGLGLEHPEPPILVSESNDTLMAGDVITLEPGCYVEGVGGMRFEHNYLITEDGCEQLSHHHLGLTR